MKYLVTITEVHGVIVEADSAEDAENYIHDVADMADITNGKYCDRQYVEVEEYGGADPADFTADNCKEV